MADHDLDGPSQLSLFSGRGILSESAGPVWLIGTGTVEVSMIVIDLLTRRGVLENFKAVSFGSNGILWT